MLLASSVVRAFGHLNAIIFGLNGSEKEFFTIIGITFGITQQIAHPVMLSSLNDFIHKGGNEK